MAAESFNILGALPQGTANISASAGTGKTFTLAALATRYVAEQDIPIGEILIVTFTRSAAAELKDRIRKRLVEAEAALRPGATPSEDELLTFLQSADRDLRHRRLEAAVGEFDAATITTIHGFAQQALSTLGLSAPADPDASLVEDSEELILTVCADVLARRSIDSHVPIELKDLNALVSKVLSLPDVAIIPEGPTEEAEAMVWVEVVNEATSRVSEARRHASVMAYDDILTQLRDAVVSGDRIATSMSDRFPIALIDEFQDTDPVQWEIFSSLFAESTLILVGDPKQAIYSFRGADVHTYVEATSGPQVQSSSLDENWRSDEALLQALNALLLNASFGEGQIDYVPVHAAEVHSQTRIQQSDGVPLPALVIRHGLEPGGKAPSAVIARAAIAADLAQQIRNLLEDATIPDGDGQRPVSPGDIAVLVRSHSETGGIQQALAAHGIPAVMSKVGSVFVSPAADQLRRLLAGVARPAAPRRVRAVALGWFGSEDAETLERFSDTAELELAERLHNWAEVLANEGVDQFAARVWAESGVATRVLPMPDGDRHLTDLEHLVEILSSTDTGMESLSINGLLERFDVLSAGDQDLAAEAIERRIESDATAVQITTVHGSKGLEWPIVCCPSLSRQLPNLVFPNVVYRDPDRAGRVIDVATKTKWGGKSEDEARRSLAKSEAASESMRLAYVALTRAQHQVIVWRHKLSRATPLSQVLFGQGASAKLSADEFEAQLAVRLASVIDLVEVSRFSDQAPEILERWVPPEAVSSSELSVARLGRELSRKSRRWSFTALSSITAEHQSGAVIVDPEDITGGDSGANDEYPTDDSPVEIFVPPVTDLIWGEVPGSAAFGTMVHSAFEEIDFQANPLRSEVAKAVAELGVWNEWPVDPEVIVEGISQAITTPLGSMFDGMALSDLGSADRLDEMIFDFTLANSGAADGHKIGELILSHLGADDALVDWATDVANGAFAVELEGHLTGAIDLIIRLHNPERYVVVDYKTNSLSEPGMPLMSSDYHPDQLPSAMAHHHYPLQALLYGVALHRYLRWRLPDYDPAQHLGGAGYLFVRGMQGPETPVSDGQPHGVFSWPIPPALISDLSDLLDGAQR